MRHGSGRNFLQTSPSSDRATAPCELYQIRLVIIKNLEENAEYCSPAPLLPCGHNHKYSTGDDITTMDMTLILERYEKH